MATTSPHQGRPPGGETSSAADCWVFDVDGCLVGSLTGSSLRPGARELLTHLAGRKVRILIWSAGGSEYAAQRTSQFGLESLVNGCFAKERRDKSGFYITSQLRLGPGRSVFV